MAGPGKSAAIHTHVDGSLLAVETSMRLGLGCLLLVAGCDLYFTNGDDAPCALGALPPAEQLRNPDTGECVAIGFPGGCGDSCSPCAELVAAPDWGSCFAGCEAFDETSCLEQAGCRAVYDANSTTDEGPRFLECWAVAPSGPVAGSCEGLGAQECSQHDNCSAFYDDDDGFLQYTGCRAEQVTGCATVDCGPNSHCEVQCTDSFCGPVCSPDANQCAAIDCAPGFECVETCQGTDPALPGCGICDAECVPIGTCESVTTEAACLARGDCGAVYSGEDCTCYSNGSCDCEVLEFARCQTK